MKTRHKETKHNSEKRSMRPSSKLKSSAKLAIGVLIALQTSQAAMADMGSAGMISPNGSVLSQADAGSSLALGSVIAINHDLTLGGRLIRQGSEMIVGEGGSLALVGTDDAKGEVVETGATINDLGAMEYTVLQQNEETGEIEPFNIPDDFRMSGPGGGAGHRSGVTNCYHVVKQIVRNRITLTGVAAYMAAPQLERAGWRRYASYESAPMGSVCVFAPGGIPTRSGGQIYGHVGVKGASGIANPTSGFHLKRPFLGCWNER
jgi:hypothetical protein